MPSSVYTWHSVPNRGMCSETWFSLTSKLTILMVTFQITVAQEYTCQNETDCGYHHLVYYRGFEKERIYIGLTNKLIQLSLDEQTEFQIEKEIATGPKDDYDTCNPSCEGNQTMKDNYNKILLVNEKSPALIVCGTVSQGTCELRNVSDISVLLEPLVNDATTWVTPNSENDSTVAFLIPQNPVHTDEQAMVVGVSYSNYEYFGSSAVYTLSTRNVKSGSAFKFVWDNSFGDGSFIQVKDDSYKIFHRAGFPYGNYSYMFTNQKFYLSSSGYVSKILRVCNQGYGQDSKKYKYVSLMDMEVICETQDGGQRYKLLTAANIVDVNGQKLLVAGFTDGTDPENLNSFNSSAVCIYKLDDVDRKFQMNLDDCLRGTSVPPNYMYWRNVERQCISTIISAEYVGNSSCGINDLLPVKGIIGRTNVTARNAEVLNEDSYITAIQTSTVADYSVLFLGTSSGHILKGCVKSTNLENIIIYDNVTVDEGNSIKGDLLLDSGKTHIFALTSKKVSRMAVQNCSKFNNCGRCMSSQDPYCGWCVLEQKCNLKVDCRYRNKSNHWLSAGKGETCLTMKIDPSFVNIQEVEISQPLTLIVKPLPATIPGEQLMVKFEGLSKTVNVIRSGDSLKCPIPNDGPLKTSKLSLIISGKETTRVTVVTSYWPFNFVDCTKITDSCSKCSKHFSCVWCIYGNACTYNHNLSMCEHGFVPSEQYSIQNGANCSTVTSQGSLPIPSNERKAVTLLGKDFPEVKWGLYYKCEISFQGGVKVRLNATRVSNTSVNCSSHTFIYNSPLSQKEGEMEGYIYLRWENETTTSIVDGSQPMTVYKCEVLGTDCSTCGSYTKEFRPQKDYKCQWCSDRSCQYEHSPQPCAVQTCPPPAVLNVRPDSTHTQGGTLVTITGNELGRGHTDINNIMLAGYECPQQTGGFIVSHQIVCKTQRVKSASGSVIVTVQHQDSKDNNSFRYGDPYVTGIEPKIGPKDGGTLVTISGVDLQIGSNRSFALRNPSDMSGDLTCTTVTESSEKHVCKTSALNNPEIFTHIVVVIDRMEFNFSIRYNYTENPTLLSMKPSRSFQGGGRVITIRGTNFDSIQEPKMFLWKDGCKCKEELCNHAVEDKAGTIYCNSPPLQESCEYCGTARRRRRQADGGSSIGFIMDDVVSVRKPSKFRIIYVQDPVYFNFTEEKYIPEEVLSIKGENLTQAATKEDVSVFVCNSSCMVTGLTDTTLVCTLPDDVKDCEKIDGKENLEVTVKVGYLEYPLGSLVKIVKVFPLEYIIPPIAIIVVLVFLLIGIALKFRSHKQARQKDMMRLQNEYELLESSVRHDARQEFADLQQDIKLVTSDVVRQGVPYKELAHYTYMILFPADIMAENTLLNHSQPAGMDENFNQGCLELLDDLIGKTSFLLPCLRALEMEKKMSAKDKSNLANLLTVVMLNKLNYMMQIWMELLKEHVSKAVERKQHKQIMRRNETIVEKMISNWLSLCMYDNMKNHTGSSLYMLYKATEMRTDSGPVDAVTGEAHYTLSEERLLKETVSTNQLTITVLVNEIEYSCKVLDCDSISQAKLKFLNQIYASAPASDRPREDQVDLEWHCGANGRLILDNFDNTTEADGDWRRINTLEHYNVKNDSRMALLSKEDEGIETDSPCANLGCSSTNLLSTGDINVEIDSRIWHLVKPEDDKEDTKQRVIPEIYLTRLMSTKVPLLNFLNDFVETVFNASHVPKAVKFLFDCFDDLAQDNGIQDSDISYIWKSNSLPIRYWGNLLKAPHHAFDVFKPDLSEPSLEVLAQCFIDSCSLTDLKMGKDSPASKLLFSRDVLQYRRQVATFYEKVADSPKVSKQEVEEEVSNLSLDLHRNNLFNRKTALFELSKILKLYEDQIIEGLEENPDAKKLQLGHKMEEFLEKMTS